MKRIQFILLLTMITLSTRVFSQSDSPDSLYIVTYTTGEGWDHTKSPNDQPYFKEHSSHLSSLRKSGTITFGARYAEKGIIIVKARSRAHADELINSDQAIDHKLFNADIQRLSVFYPGCIER